MNELPICNEKLVVTAMYIPAPEPSMQNGVQRLNKYSQKPEWNIHIVRSGFRGPETVTVNVASETAPEFVQGQLPVFANLSGRYWSKLHGDRPSAGLMASADAVQFVEPGEFMAAVNKQRDIEARHHQQTRTQAAGRPVKVEAVA